MTLPRFTAGASLYKTDRHYRSATSGALPVSGAFLAQLESELENGEEDMDAGCYSECVEVGGSEEECMEECSAAEAGEEV